jgi:hypothetical protein
MAEDIITFTSAQLAQKIPGSTRWTWREALLSHPGYVGTKSPVVISNEHYQNLLNYFINVLNILDTVYPGYIISSCYREGDERQHGKGQACDIDFRVSSKKQGREVFLWIKDNIDYDQLIWETNNIGGTPPGPDGYPNWIHISYSLNHTSGHHKQVLWTTSAQLSGPYYGWNDANMGTPGPGDGSGTESDKTTTKTGDEIEEQDKEKLSYIKTFEQIQASLASLEASDVETTWGKGLQPKNCDWISLKQFLLYLGTRYCPQSLYPFIELIPAITLKESAMTPAQAFGYGLDESGETYQSDGTIPPDQQENINNSEAIKELIKKIKEKIATYKALMAEKGKSSFNIMPPTRSETSLEVINKSAGVADLFGIDPFHDDFNFIGEPSDAGLLIKGQRGIGVRAYGQLVLTPGAISGVSSKPGPIGFKELEIQAGAQCENGIALITMKIVDVQGNKFTDMNSPWSFIYDARPGNIGGDFYFRYGWSIRLPDPKNYSDRTAQLFWTHPGWKTFGEGLRNDIMSKLNPSNPCIVLTQAINTMGIPNPTIDPKNPDKILYNLFDEGLIYNEKDGTVTLERNQAYLLQNYVKLTILNPELEVDENAAMIAKLSFRTTGAIAQSIPLVFAKKLRDTIKLTTTPTLGDLLLAAMTDMTTANFFAIADKNDRAKQFQTSFRYFNRIAHTRDFTNLVYVLGVEEGGNTGSVHPDDFIIDVDDDYVKELINPPFNGEDTIIRWLRNVIEDNDCELNSAATGSGAGINAAWVITVTKDADKENYRPKKHPLPISITDKLNQTDALSFMMAEQDVFSYRFQGSLVTNMTVEKTEGDNALKIQADYEIGDFDTYKTDDKKDKFTLEDFQSKFTPKSTLDNRYRTLRILYSQLQTIKITAMAHPWLGPGRKIFVKGMGFFDGEFLILEVTHTLGNDMLFKTELKAGRMLMKDPSDEEKKIAKDYAVTNGDGNITSKVDEQYEGTAFNLGKVIGNKYLIQTDGTPTFNMFSNTKNTNKTIPIMINPDGLPKGLQGEL